MRYPRLFVPSKRLVNLIAKQHLLLPNPHYNVHLQQGKMTCTTREALLNWCLHLQREFDFSHETTFLAINFLDRHLSSTKVTRTPHLHLLTTTCVYLASKFGEELNEPCISDMAEVSAFPTSTSDIKRTESKLLKSLQWELTPTTPQSILSELLTSIAGNPLPESIRDRIMKEAQSFFTIALSDVSFLQFQPATLVFTVLNLVAPGLFQMLGLGKVFMFDASLMVGCSEMLMQKSLHFRR
ncbi:hypothetical protein HDU98_010432 [Podochytrium sp. JEL0797]|nr:hypothetical protein HDU98_010432 [Podochytrium sp. JEL0797]